jgi:hypothetical protein
MKTQVLIRARFFKMGLAEEDEKGWKKVNCEK